MSKTYTVTLTDAEDKALATIAVNPFHWIEGVVKERARVAIEDIVNAEIQRKLAANETISGTKEDIVNAADIETAAEKQARFEALMANR